MENTTLTSTKDGYLTFDALSIKQHIKDKLNEAGIFSDQNYEGSYITTIIDIIAYTFNVLMFYLNKTSTENLFSDAQLYENMNRIVKLIDYKPIGVQTATLSFNARVLGSGETSSPGLYTIPRYSFISLGGINYSINEDITFTKTLDSIDEDLVQMSAEKLLYQGSYREYPIYTAIGEEHEQIILTPGNDVLIDHFNIDVYVRDANDVHAKWEQWAATPSLYLETAMAKKYEIRLNENKRYEIKFGNGINGKRLEAGYEVAIYYLQSNGKDGEVGTNVLDGRQLIKYKTSQFDTIIGDVVDDDYTILDSLITLEFSNTTPSTYMSDGDSVDDIRDNSPGSFRSQYRLVTGNDYYMYIKSNFANLIDI